MDNYEVLGVIGKGNFGSISKVKRKTDNKLLVWKELDYGKMSEKEKQHIVSEVNILRELKHPNIVRYFDRIIDKKNTKIYIIMEFCEGGDIGALVKRCKKNKEFIAEDVIWKIFTQIVLALHECHTRKEGKILHRDLKPSNIFLDAENNVKLGDFGLSRVLSNESVFAYSHVGTPYYMSPEQIDEIRYNEKSDIWSLGCFLFEISSFSPPFEATNHLSLALKIKSGKVDRIPSRYSEELNRVINWMLSVDQERRPSVEDLLNLPQISLRLRERRLKDNMTKLKKYEESLKIKEEELEEKSKSLEEKEKELLAKEESLRALEKKLIEKEKFNFSSNFGYSTSGQTAGTSSEYLEKKNLESSGCVNNIPKKENNEFTRSCYVCNMRESSCSCERDAEYTTSNSSKRNMYTKKCLDSPSQWIDTNVSSKVSAKQISESIESFGKVNTNFTNINNIQSSMNIQDMFSERKGSRGEYSDGGNIQTSVSAHTNRLNLLKQKDPCNYITLQENSFNNGYNSSVFLSKNFEREGGVTGSAFSQNQNTTNIQHNPPSTSISNQWSNSRQPSNSKRSSAQTNINQMRISEQIPSSKALITRDSPNLSNINESPSNTMLSAKFTKERVNQLRTNNNTFKFDPSLYRESSVRKEEEFSEESRKPPMTSSSKPRQTSTKNSNTRSIYSSHKNLLTATTPQSDTYATLTSPPQMSNRLVNTPIKDQMKFSSGKYASILTREPRSNSPSVGNAALNNYNTINSVRKSKIPYK